MLSNAFFVPKLFSIIFVKNFYYDSYWMDVIKTDEAPPTTISSLQKITTPQSIMDEDLVDEKQDDDVDSTSGVGIGRVF
jgi:hypothetical protein